MGPNCWAAGLPSVKIQLQPPRGHRSQISPSHRSAPRDVSSLNPKPSIRNPLPVPALSPPRFGGTPAGGDGPSADSRLSAQISRRGAPHPRLRRRHHHAHAPRLPHLSLPRRLGHCECIPLSLTLTTGHFTWSTSGMAAAPVDVLTHCPFT